MSDDTAREYGFIKEHARLRTWPSEPFTRPASDADLSSVASVAEQSSEVEPAPVAPTHTGESQAVGEGSKPVSSLHSSGECNCVAFSLTKMRELGEIVGWQQAIKQVREVLTDPTARQQIDALVAREFPALFAKLQSEVAG